EPRHLVTGELPGLVARAIALGEGDDAVSHLERGEHVQVLARLRHHPLVGVDDPDEHVDAGRARDHGADEALVAGPVDDAQRAPARAAAPAEPGSTAHTGPSSSVRGSEPPPARDTEVMTFAAEPIASAIRWARPASSDSSARSMAIAGIAAGPSSRYRRNVAS